MKAKRINLVLFSASTFIAGQFAIAQEPPQLENMLNRVDSPSVWLKTPVSGIGTPQMQSQPNIINPNFGSAQSMQSLENSATGQSQILNQNGNTLFNRQQILRIFLGGTATNNLTSASGSNQSPGTAYSDWQQAENEASRAHDAEGRARYDKNKGDRESDASEAYYAANTARAASDRIYQASLNGDATAKEYADRARAAADRARADSDRARYYADSSE